MAAMAGEKDVVECAFVQNELTSAPFFATKVTATTLLCTALHCSACCCVHTTDADAQGGWLCVCMSA